MVECYQDLKVWQKAHQFVLEIYKITKKFPVNEQFGLSIQFRRSAVSVPANISEGSKRQYTKELIQFLHVAKGSLGECEYYLTLSKDLGYIGTQDFEELLSKSMEIGRMLTGLIQSLRRKKFAPKAVSSSNCLLPTTHYQLFTSKEVLLA